MKEHCKECGYKSTRNGYFHCIYDEERNLHGAPICLLETAKETIKILEEKKRALETLPSKKARFTFLAAMLYTLLFSLLFGLSILLLVKGGQMLLESPEQTETRCPD